MPKISIIIPVFNVEKYLDNCLNSLKNQTFSDWECILVDDGSTDKSLEIATAFANTDNRFKVFSQKHSGNPQTVRDFARLRTTTDWIFSVDSDDYLASDCLEKLINRQIETKADVVLLQLNLFDNKTQDVLLKIPNDAFDFNQLLSGADAVKLTIGEWQISNNGLFRKTLYKSQKKHSKNFLNFDEYTQRVVLLGAKTVAFSDVGYFYRQHPESLTKRTPQKHFSSILSRKFLKIFPARVILWVARIHTSLKRFTFL